MKDKIDKFCKILTLRSELKRTKRRVRILQNKIKRENKKCNFWLMKAYIEIFNTIGFDDFLFSDVEKIYEENTNTLLSDMYKANLIDCEIDKSDRRKRIYKLRR